MIKYKLKLNKLYYAISFLYFRNGRPTKIEIPATTTTTQRRDENEDEYLISLNLCLNVTS